MRLELRMKYCETVYRRYRNASKESKARILDELCQVCGYNRKYAIWKLNRLRDKEKAKTPGKRRRRRKYGHEVLLIVEEVWKKSGYPWSVRLKEILRLWLPWIKKHYQVTAEVEEKLLEISPSTMDRHLKPLKNKLKRRIYGRTKPGTLLRHKIPVKTDHWDVEQPGYLEADLVSHSGESGYGEFMHSLNFTDIFSQWVETQAVMGKGREGILEAFGKISRRLPFRILGIDSDNGSEFINHHLWNYCEERGIQFTRSRPYKKDDNAHIEQKNWTHVRKLMGWDRYDSPQALVAMNDLYEKELPLYMNLFQPSVKLLKTERKGSRKNRLYSRPLTPLDRLLASEHIDQSQKEELIALREKLDPFELAETVDQKLQQIWKKAHYRYKPPKTKIEVRKEQQELSQEEKETLEDIASI
ncbi:MAG: transposase family protein, partial [Desulfobacterales bacterium]|nr:transposase family protein [Desulfobacterales bacterium]